MSGFAEALSGTAGFQAGAWSGAARLLPAGEAGGSQL